MMPNLWRTLAEAAAWLQSETGRNWTARDVLRTVIAATKEGDRYLPIAFPAGDACVRCELFVPQPDRPSYITSSTLLALGVRQADELLIRGATLQSGGELYGRPNHRWLGTDASIEIGLDDLRIAEQTLRALVSEPAAEVSANESASPSPLSTGDMAYLLRGIERTQADWRKMLANAPKWLIAAQVSRGAPGVRASEWNPVTVALALQSRGVPAESLRAIFANRLAAHWADAWARANQAADDYDI